MVKFFSSHCVLYRYDASNISHWIVGGSIRVSTLEYCRKTENEFARDSEEGTKTTTSLPGTNSLNSRDLAKLLGVDPRGIHVSGANAVVTVGENAVRRTQTLDNAFVFCTSAIGNDVSMKSKFGNGCLKINDALAFFELIDDYLRKAVAPHTLSECVVDDVEYTLRTNNYRDHTSKHSAFIKPFGDKNNFENEAEVRAIWIAQGFKAEPVVLKIPEISKLVELLS